MKVRNIEIGEGIPKICVPVTGITKEGILRQTKEAVKYAPDLLEWRADFYEALWDKHQVAALIEKIRRIIGDIGLIYTIRTTQEGGNCQITPESYADCLMGASDCDIDFVDVEWFQAGLSRERLVNEIHQKQKLIIASNHHFHETPSLAEMERILHIMEITGADVRKLAVMPQKPEDVLKLLTATVHARETGLAPVITMSMSKMGAISRVCGQVFGSAVTFATVEAASAPGQMQIDELRQMLNCFKI